MAELDKHRPICMEVYEYTRARLQKYFPAKVIKLILGLVILFLSVRCITKIF